MACRGHLRTRIVSYSSSHSRYRYLLPDVVDILGFNFISISVSPDLACISMFNSLYIGLIVQYLRSVFHAESCVGTYIHYIRIDFGHLSERIFLWFDKCLFFKSSRKWAEKQGSDLILRKSRKSNKIWISFTSSSRRRALEIVHTFTALPDDVLFQFNK